MSRNHSKPMFESLESRQLFAAAAPTVPDLKVSLTYTPPAEVIPGNSITPEIFVKNLGSNVRTDTKVPIDFYLSTTPKLAADATPFHVVDKIMKIKSGQTDHFKIPVTIPLNLPAHTYYVIIRVNKPAAIRESSFANNTVVTGPLHNPTGTYAGHFTGDDGRTGKLTLKLDSETAITALFSDFIATYSDARIHVAHIRSRFSAANVLKITAKNGYDDPTLGRLTYNLSLTATLTDNTLIGSFQLRWHTSNVNRNATATFKISR
ncbi:MAG TPA: hypothetical protein VFE58_19805 [Tepidisphaeraceae bacterium]|jgi:hypothetical protein|nr:hypothetical protein [Tepidisphaeraceae bacterium]